MRAGPLRLGCGLASLLPVPQDCGSLPRRITGLPAGGLCAFPTLRALFFFLFSSRKDAKPQRNSGPFLSATADKPDYPQMGQLPLDKGARGIYSRKAHLSAAADKLLAPFLLCAPYSFFLFYSRKALRGGQDAEAQRNCSPLG